MNFLAIEITHASRSLDYKAIIQYNSAQFQQISLTFQALTTIHQILFSETERTHTNTQITEHQVDFLTKCIGVF